MHPIPLQSCDVHVWRAALSLQAPWLPNPSQILAADECERAAHFRLPRDRDRFVAARIVLRVILGHYLSIAPQEIRFSYGPHGKPALATEHAANGLRFNLSHSSGVVLIALARGREVGVDVEYIRPNLEYDQLAVQFFSPAEAAALRALPAERRVAAFFACWTRKEAYVKARGDGLVYPLDRFTVSLAPGEPAALLSVDGDALEGSRWSLYDLVPAPGYAAALATEGQARLSEWRWPEEWPASC